MELFKEENYGKLISKELSDYLKKYTTRDDWAVASTFADVGFSTVKAVVYGHNTLTEKSSKAIIALHDTAIKNCSKEIEEATEAKGVLMSMVA